MVRVELSPGSKKECGGKTNKPRRSATRFHNGKEISIIDMRQGSEVAIGKVLGAKHIPIGHLALRTDKLDKDKTYIVTWLSGNRSKPACGILGV